MPRRWTIEKASTLDKGSTPFLFSFTHAQRHALLAIVDVLRWDSSWVRDNIPEPLTDNEQYIIDDLIHRLMEYEDMNEIAAAIRYFADAHAGQDFTDDCCSSGVNFETGLPPASDTTDYSNDENLPEGTTRSEWDLARCEDSNWIADELIRMARATGNLDDIAVGIGTISGMLTLVSAMFPPAWIVVAVAVTLFSLATVLMSLVADNKLGVVRSLAENWDTNKQELVCLIYNANSPAAVVSVILADVHSRVQNLGYSVGDADLIQSLFKWIISPEVINSVFDNVGENAPAGYVGSIDCSACAVLPTLFTFDTDTEGWYLYSQSDPPPTSTGWYNAGEPPGSIRTSWATDTVPDVRCYWSYNLLPHGVVVGAGSSWSMRFRMGGANPQSVRCWMYVFFEDGSSEGFPRSGYETSYKTMTAAIDAAHIGKTIKRISVYHIKLDNSPVSCWFEMDNINITGLL